MKTKKNSTWNKAGIGLKIGMVIYNVLNTASVGILGNVLSALVLTVTYFTDGIYKELSVLKTIQAIGCFGSLWILNSITLGAGSWWAIFEDEEKVDKAFDLLEERVAKYLVNEEG